MVPKRRYPVVMSQKVEIKPQHQENLQTKVDFKKNLDGHTGVIIPDEYLENSTELRPSSSVITVGKDNTVSIIAINLNDHAITYTKNKQAAVFQFLSPQEEEELIEIGPDFLAIDRMKKEKFLEKLTSLWEWEKQKEADNRNALSWIWQNLVSHSRNMSKSWQSTFLTEKNFW